MVRRTRVARLTGALVAGFATSVAVATAQAPSGAAPTGAGGAASVELDPALPLASNVVDLDVVNPRRERLGEIVDIALDPATSVRAYVIALGARAGAPDRYVAVPAAALRIQRAPDGRWTAELDTSLEQLKAAPAIPYKSGWNQ